MGRLDGLIPDRRSSSRGRGGGDGGRFGGGVLSDPFKIVVLVGGISLFACGTYISCEKNREEEAATEYYRREIAKEAANKPQGPAPKVEGKKHSFLPYQILCFCALVSGVFSCLNPVLAWLGCCSPKIVVGTWAFTIVAWVLWIGFMCIAGDAWIP